MANYTSLKEFFAALSTARNGLFTGVSEGFKGLGNEMAKAVGDRASTTGKNADNGSFSTPYSRSHAYKRKNYGSGYLGTQTNYKGFYFQGTMWSGFKVTELRVDTQRMTAVLGFEGDNRYITNSKINELQSKREGLPIGALNETEQEALVDKLGFMIGEYLKSVL